MRKWLLGLAITLAATGNARSNEIVLDISAALECDPEACAANPRTISFSPEILSPGVTLVIDITDTAPQPFSDFDASAFLVPTGGGPSYYGSQVTRSLDFSFTYIDPPVVDSVSVDGVSVLIWATPEPSTWAMMLIGFAGLGFLGYQRARAA
jgi:hypothetical protein